LVSIGDPTATQGKGRYFCISEIGKVPFDGDITITLTFTLVSFSAYAFAAALGISLNEQIKLADIRQARRIKDSFSSTTLSTVAA
jgi:hypothetical protein